MRFTTVVLLQCLMVLEGFSPLPPFQYRNRISPNRQSYSYTPVLNVGGGGIVLIVLDPEDDNREEPIEPEDDEEEDDDDEEEDTDPYRETASSEFLDDKQQQLSSSSSSSALTMPVGTTSLDWGAEYGLLAERMEENGNTAPSKALFRIMASETPNQAISKFLRTANPQVVGAMSGAVSSLLGGLSSPSKGIETIVKTTGDKIGNLCFQLQMTGYMFRNAEYVMALKELMNLKGGATLEDYKEAFDRLDQDRSGYIDTDEIEALLADVYDGDVPGFEIDSFMHFFDSNHDGKISWQEFEKGLGNISQTEAATAFAKKAGFILPSSDEDPDDEIPDLDATVSGEIEIEFDDGKTITLEANEYIDMLKKEAEELKVALRQEIQSTASGMGGAPGGMMPMGNAAAPREQVSEGIASYIASRKDDLQSLTNTVQPDIMDTMKLLVDFVITGRNPRTKNKPREELEMQIPGAALQQLALWQLVLGYKLREAEATGDYLKLLE